MSQINFDNHLLENVASRTVIITGAAGGIGAATTKTFIGNGANVVLADLPSFEGMAHRVIASLPEPSHAMFVPVDITHWEQMIRLFKRTIETFGAVHVVVANAGTMESEDIMDMENIDDEGILQESNEAFKVIDVNLKGTLNTLRLGMYFMRKKHVSSVEYDGILRSIVLVSSTSGYFGGTGVTAYIASKHGVTGLLRGSQKAAKKYGISVKAVAPFFTPTKITSNLAEKWKKSGLEANTPDMVGTVIAQCAAEKGGSGSCFLVSGRFLRELQFTRTDMMAGWLGQDVVDFMHEAFQFITDIGGYQLPNRQV